MKKLLTSTLFLVAFALVPASTGQPKEEVIPPGMIRFTSADVMQVLDVYREISRCDLVISSHVRQRSTRVTVQSQVQLKMSEAAKFLEQALIEQTGVVITRLDEKRVSVTYNDALPTKPVTEGRPVPELKTKDGLPLPPPQKRTQP